MESVSHCVELGGGSYKCNFGLFSPHYFDYIIDVPNDQAGHKGKKRKTTTPIIWTIGLN